MILHLYRPFHPDGSVELSRIYNRLYNCRARLCLLRGAAGSHRGHNTAEGLRQRRLSSGREHILVLALELKEESANHDSPRTKQLCGAAGRVGAMGSGSCAKERRLDPLLSAEPLLGH